jgi:hypothetical protein
MFVWVNSHHEEGHYYYKAKHVEIKKIHIKPTDVRLVGNKHILTYVYWTEDLITIQTVYV